MLHTSSEIDLPTDEIKFLPQILSFLDRHPQPTAAQARHAADLIMRSPYFRFWVDDDRRPGIPDLAEAIARRDPAALLRMALRSDGRRDPAAPLVGRWYGDKTPRYARFLPLLHRHFPEARFVAMRRDPRAVVASMTQDWDKSILIAALIWHDTVSDLLDFERAGVPVLTIRYEDLVADPERSLRRITESLEVDPISFDGRLSASSGSERWGRATGATHVVPETKAWCDVLSHAQVCAVEAVVGDFMETVGYERVTETPQRHPASWQCQLARRIDTIRTLVAYMRERGPIEGLRYRKSIRDLDRLFHA